MILPECRTWSFPVLWLCLVLWLSFVLFLLGWCFTHAPFPLDRNVQEKWLWTMKKNRALANTFPRNMLIFPYSQLRSNRLSPQQTRLPYVYQVKEIDWNLRQWCAPVYRRRWGAQTPLTVNFIVQKPKLKCISIPKAAESVLDWSRSQYRPKWIELNMLTDI